MVKKTPSKKLTRAQVDELLSKKLSPTAAAPKGLTAEGKKAWEELRDSRNSQVWTHDDQVGAYIEGKLLAVESVKGKFGEQMALRIETEDGPKTVFARTVLRREVEEKQPQTGDRVLIVFQGYAGGKKGRPAEICLLAVTKKAKGSK